MRIPLPIIFLLSTHVLLAQTFSISGKVKDDTGQPAIGATVSLQHPWGEQVSGTSSSADGAFVFAGVGKGGYNIVVSMLGFKNYKKQVTLSSSDVQLGDLTLEADPLVLGAVDIKSTVPTALQ